jgi:MOSC domain-containing protein YiiM
MKLIERRFPEWTIARVNEILYDLDSHLSDAKQLSECSLLAENLRGYFAHVVERDSRPAQ